MTATTDRHLPSGRRRTLARAAAALVATGVAVLGYASPVSAHVTVNPSETTQGGYAALTFRVPNEKDNASTTKLEVAMPTDTPLASVSVKPVPGWTVATTTSKLAKPVKTDDGELTETVSKITWTATSPANAIAPHQFQEFSISGGPMPEADTLVFKALQTYSNGEIVRWIDETTDGGAEPEHPAPTLTLVKGSGDDHHGNAASESAAAASDDNDNADSDDGGDGVAIGLGIAGLVAGLAGLAAGLLALRRSATARA